MAGGVQRCIALPVNPSSSYHGGRRTLPAAAGLSGCCEETRACSLTRLFYEQDLRAW